MSKTDSFNYQGLISALPGFIGGDQLVALNMLKVLPQIQGFLHKSLILNEFNSKLFDALNNDEDSLKIAAINAIFSLSEKLEPSEIKRIYIPFLTNFLYGNPASYSVNLQIFKHLG